jgi:aconitate hydratase
LRPQPYFQNGIGREKEMGDIRGARALVVLGDNVTTDHISPAGAIPAGSVAGRYLAAKNVPVAEFNQYSTRRGNFEVMLRGVFSHGRLGNALAGPGQAGGVTRDASGELMPVYDAAQSYRRTVTPLIVVAGRDYGAGSSRDWAAKGPALLGVRAVIAESFERIHRSNLVGMGILPLQFADGRERAALALDGSETFDLVGLEGALRPRENLILVVNHPGKLPRRVAVLLRVETQLEAEYLRQGGILHYILRQLLSAYSTSTAPCSSRS